MISFAQRLNNAYFANRLSPRMLEELTRVEGQRDEVLQFAERLARLFMASGIDATDVPITFGRGLHDVIPHILPGAWNGLVPSITYPNRHACIDRYLAANRWAMPGPGTTLLDLGCGFPPITSVDTAERFPDWSIIAIDRAHWPYMILDHNGDRALFDETKTLRYFQPEQPGLAAWRQILQDMNGTKARFSQLLQEMLERVPDETTVALECDGVRLVLNPTREYARPNLTFARGDLLLPDLPAAHLARCFNVLCYFDDAFRQRTLRNVGGILHEGGLLITGVDWAETMLARYLVYRNNHGQLEAKEFAFTLDYLRASTAFFTLHDDDIETRLLATAVSTLRRDRIFFPSFSARLDALHDQHDLWRRGEDGYLGDIPDMSGDELVRRSLSVMTAIEEEGYGIEAVQALRRAGFDAWTNEAGHVAFAPGSIAAGGES